MMQKFAFFTFFFLILAGCTASPSPAVFDPNLSAVRSQMTANAANDDAQIYAVMATGTAQAPIVHITETAAEFSFIGTKASIDGTSTAILWTSTPSPVP